MSCSGGKLEELTLLAERLDALEAELSEHRENASLKDEETIRLQAELRDIQASLSWKITAPLRQISGTFRKIVRSFRNT